MKNNRYRDQLSSGISDQQISSYRQIFEQIGIGFICLVPQVNSNNAVEDYVIKDMNKLCHKTFFKSIKDPIQQSFLDTLCYTDEKLLSELSAAVKTHTKQEFDHYLEGKHQLFISTEKCTSISIEKCTTLMQV